MWKVSSPNIIPPSLRNLLGDLALNALLQSLGIITQPDVGKAGFQGERHIFINVSVSYA